MENLKVIRSLLASALNELDKVINQESPSIHSDIINFMNIEFKTKYKSSSKDIIRLINQRLNEGYTLDDFKTVILNKKEEWQGTEFHKYLRPQTLFGNKFQAYLNQIDPNKNLASKLSSFLEQGKKEYATKAI